MSETIQEKLLTLNFMPILNKGNKEHFLKSKMIIGCSQGGLGSRKIVMEHCLQPKKEGTMRMLVGKLTHKPFQEDRVRIPMIEMINDCLFTTRKIGDHQYLQLYNGNWMKVVSMNEYQFFDAFPTKRYIRIGENRFLRQHPDIIVLNLYIIEIKFTAMDYKDMTKDEYLNKIFRFIVQLNTYLGINGLPFGFLLIVNKGIYTTASKSWEFVKNNYIRFIYHEFNQELFDRTLEKTNKEFDHIEREDFFIECPQELWECDKEKKYCPVRDDCKNPIDKVKMDKESGTCFHCKEAIEMGTTALMRNDRLYHNSNEECIQACKSDWRYE